MKKMILAAMLACMFSSGTVQARVFTPLEYQELRRLKDTCPWLMRQWQDMRPKHGINDGLSELA